MKQTVSYYNNLNLSNRPFRNRGLPWTVALILAAGSLIALFIIFSQNQQVTRQSALVQSDVNKLKGEISQIKQQDQEVAQSLTPQQKRDWFAAHDLINRKRFPWSRLFTDLEGILPAGVRVNRIGVRDIAARDGDIVSEFEMVLQSSEPLIINTIIERMQNGGVFQAEMINQTLLKGKDEKGLESALRVRYRSRAGVATGATQVATVQTGGTQ